MDELSKIGSRYVTDKVNHHDYCRVYDRYFSLLRGREIILIEAGIGGYHLTNQGGGSLRMWRDYFPLGKIFGFDMHDKSFLNSDRIKVFNGRQDDDEFLENMISETGAPDIFIDDCSHDTPLTLATFEIVFPKLKSGGIYVVEDTHTSYFVHPNHHGTLDFYASKYSSPQNYFKALTDSLNVEHIPNYSYSSFREFWGMIENISFHEKMIFIFKK